MKEPNIQTLNEILKGEHMAIEGYQTVLSTIEDQQLKERLNGILEDHKRHAMEITDRIYKLGGNPNGSTGMADLMADMKLKVEGLVSRNHVMIHELYQGEKHGIEAVKKTIEGDLDADSLRLVEDMIETDTRHLGELEEMME